MGSEGFENSTVISTDRHLWHLMVNYSSTRKDRTLLKSYIIYDNDDLIKKIKRRGYCDKDLTSLS